MSALKMSIIVAATFLGASALYIMFSDWLVLELTHSTEQVRRVQSVKGLVYVSVVAVGLFGLVYGMLRRIEEQTRKLQSGREALLSVERRTVAGTLAASIAHDANNLVAVIQSNLDFLLRRASQDEMSQEALEDAAEATRDLGRLNDRLRKDARRQAGETRQDINLAELVDGVFQKIRTHSKLADRQVDMEVEETLQAEIYPDLVTHALVNILLNAADATGAGGHIRVMAQSGGETVLLCVEDDGPGIPEDQRDEVLEPFVTSKEEGTGLGLFSVAYCVDEHQGEFEIGTSDALGGAKMMLRLPKTAPDETTGKPSRPSLVARTLLASL